MRIGVNASMARGSLAGIGNYSLKLARYLPHIAPNDEWVLFGPDSQLLSGYTRSSTKIVERTNAVGRMLWEQTVLPFAARAEKLDLLHGTDYIRPFTYHGRTVNTVHDLSPYANERFFPLAKTIYKRALISFAASMCEAIITVSAFSRSEILNRFPRLADRVFAIHLGVEPISQHGCGRPRPPFLLFVGTLEYRKNVVRLIEAFRIYCMRRGTSHRLVLAGQAGYGWQAIRAAIENSRFSDFIDVLGYVSPDDLANLYGAASLFIYPSSYEGFGLPLAEAMSYSAPVISSNAASLPEVGGDAALYFDPHDVEELADAMERVLDSPTLQAELKDKSRKQAAKFTWEKCVRKHVEVYRKVLQA